MMPMSVAEDFPLPPTPVPRLSQTYRTLFITSILSSTCILGISLAGLALAAASRYLSPITSIFTIIHACVLWYLCWREVRRGVVSPGGGALRSSSRRAGGGGRERERGGWRRRRMPTTRRLALCATAVLVVMWMVVIVLLVFFITKSRGVSGGGVGSDDGRVHQGSGGSVGESTGGVIRTGMPWTWTTERVLAVVELSLAGIQGCVTLALGVVSLHERMACLHPRQSTRHGRPRGGEMLTRGSRSGSMDTTGILAAVAVAGRGSRGGGGDEASAEAPTSTDGDNARNLNVRSVSRQSSRWFWSLR
ncbi:hypothetical protein CC2G_012227 [Coprinopsis cinerea AmutBmut pab1-1]|nr:hypothetical protein CC2G_012227 [Coprinopsis cinerea AmutBmut pab1-1]